jgi:trigger factor
MQVKISHPSKTEAIVAVVSTPEELQAIKVHVLTHFQNDVKVPGFRSGKIPAEVLEKHVDQSAFQNRFIEEAVEQLYGQAVQTNQLRVVDRPQISLTKFVPFTTLEFEAKVPIISEIKLADYKKIKLAKKAVTISTGDIKNVISSLKTRMAEKKDVDRAAQESDQVWIDFKGVNDKGEPVSGADGKDYPLVLGSKTFIPGFEENLTGLKAGDEKTFTLKFPSDYGVKTLANKKVSFTVNVTKVQEVVEPKVDDDFAAKVGPFKTVSELKADIKKQLTHERRHELDREYESELIRKVSDKSEVDVPAVLINDQIERFMQDLRQNINYRGLTEAEYLEGEGKTEEQYRQDVVKPQAIERVKASLVLAEIAEIEKLEVSPEELEVRIQTLKGQYQDPQMQAELNKPEAKRDIASRILTEKTVKRLTDYATKK